MSTDVLTGSIDFSVRRREKKAENNPAAISVTLNP